MIETYSYDEHYDMLSKWWRAHKFEPVIPQLLTPHGIVCSVEGRPTAAAWIYPIKESCLAIMEWFVGNPSATATAIMRAIKLIVAYFADWCKTEGYAIMMTSTNKRGLVKLYERNGFTKTDEGLTHLGMIL